MIDGFVGKNLGGTESVRSPARRRSPIPLIDIGDRKWTRLLWFFHEGKCVATSIR